MSNAKKPSFPDFGKLVPGFDFLQNLTRQATESATQNIPQLPNLGNWVAPTLNVEELDKRIQELKAVQFWLDQNASALKATIQALEVQKMTLATLKGMNFNMGDVANAFKLKVADSVASGVQAAADKAKTFSGFETPTREPKAEAPADTPKKEDKAADPANRMVDPMQWWGALTEQFQTIAAEAMKEAAKKTAFDAGKGLTKEAMKSATGLAKGMAESATKTVTDGARAALGSAMRGAQGWSAAPAGKTAPKAKPAVKASVKSAATPKATAKTKPKAASPARKAVRKKAS